MKDFKDLRVNTRHVKLRTVAFVIAFTIAVGAFAVGIAAFGRRESGYYTVTPDPSGDALFYASGIELNCYFEGSSREVRAQQTAAREAYSRALLKWYKLLDAENTYADAVNLATVNNAAGEWVEVSPELYAVLEDAVRIAGQYPQVSITAGALYAEWDSILTLASPQEFDPLTAPDEAARFSSIMTALGEPDAVRLEFDAAKNAVRLNKSASYRQTETELELDGTALDLALLHDAYLLSMTASALQESGIDRGILSAESGLCVSLSATETGDYLLRAGAAADASTLPLPLPGGAAVAQCRSYPEEGETVGYYTAETAGEVRYRSPWIDASTGDIPDAALCSYAAARLSARSLPQLVCDAFRLFSEGEAGTQAPGTEKVCLAAAFRDKPDEILRFGADEIQ